MVFLLKLPLTRRDDGQKTRVVSVKKPMDLCLLFVILNCCSSDETVSISFLCRESFELDFDQLLSRCLLEASEKNRRSYCLDELAGILIDKFVSYKLFLENTDFVQYRRSFQFRDHQEEKKMIW